MKTQTSTEFIRQCLLYAFVYLLCVVMTSAQAQSVRPIVPNDVRPPPVIRIDAPNASVPIKLERVTVDGDIAGSLAKTTVELIIANPNTQTLEGELQFPLLDGQIISGFALDINGEMRDAVPVEKAKGQEVFEEVIRARIDPALLEVTAGNHYKLRVYPLPGKGTRRVRLEITQTLAVVEGKLQYQLPLLFAEQIDQLDVALRLPDNATARLGAQTLPIESDDKRAVLTFNRRDFKAADVLQIALPAQLKEPYVSTQTYKNETWFYAELPEDAAPSPRPAPKKIALFWDASASGANRNHDKEFALLDAWFKKLVDVRVELIVVRDTAEAPQSFTIQNGEWRPLQKALERLPYDGATQAGIIRIPADADLALLLTDGLFNYGEQTLPAASVPFYIAGAAAGADSARLSRIAQPSGGRWLDLLQFSTHDALNALTSEPACLLDLSANGADNLLAAAPSPEQGRWIIAGRLKDVRADVRLDIQLPGKEKTVRTLTVVNTPGSQGGLAAQRWGRIKIDQLAAEPHQNQANLRRTAAHFNLVTADTSLIVLDRVEDYVRYEIEPPASLRAQYEQLQANRRTGEQRDQTTHLDSIVKRFDERIQWWNRSFPKNKAIQEVKKAEVARGERRFAAPPAPPNMVVESLDANAQAMEGAPPPAEARRQAMEMEQREMVSAPSDVLMVQNTASAPAPADMMAYPDHQPATPSASASIQLKKWQPDAPYARRLRDAHPEAMYAIYLDERPGYQNSTAFFLDVAELFFERQQKALGLRILSNLAEMNLENRHILRILAYRLLQADEIQLALPILERVLALSPNEPQSYRDLALALEQAGRYQRSIDQLWEVVSRPWHDRFPDIELIALTELNAILAKAERQGEKLDTGKIDSRLLRNLPLDLRVILSWDADNTDIDLWVTDPNGEQAYYGYPQTRQGGLMSRDFRSGYGPEEFALREAIPGKYTVHVQFYGHTQQTIAPATTLMLRLTTHFGSAGQRDENVVLRLSGRGDRVMIGEFEIGR